MTETRPIVFIDTNIWLDAYRSRNDVGLHLIKRLDDVQKHLISTYQVEMEFKKNRQSAILEALTSLKPPEQSISAPAFLSQAKTVELIGKNSKDTKKRISGLKARIENILANPTTHDPVYQVAQRVFNAKSDLNLNRSDKRKLGIRRRAWKRFVLGYPPRKKNDTSTGDGINWEWIVDCVETTNRDLIIVSRDGDFGCRVGENSFPNDWLVQELKERTKKTRKITLTPRLSSALDALKVKVTKEEKQEETASLQETMSSIQDTIRGIQNMQSQISITPEMIERLRNFTGFSGLVREIKHPDFPDDDDEG